MTPDQVAVVQSTLRAARCDLDLLAARFFERLSTRNPALRSLFPDDTAEQEGKVAAVLDEIGYAVHDHERLAAECVALGRRHESYGARAEHYPVFGEVLAESLAATVGDAWTVRTADAWDAAFELVTELMQSGQRSAEPLAGPVPSGRGQGLRTGRSGHR
ncbi:hemoglobin-like flavoprotein [Motilibacter peucedani]|uniref:Hemoglobin-like flavoprotein n=1 Tax=Motilibacter peucedani TaxID=598650 RepID=A0A420XQU3_9ACTN|nr:globin domain-containing protein [Motilibacter peucedani]RKS75594.1 hemoglobin-like flavoprotein [Motilibacter peucedani]